MRVLLLAMPDSIDIFDPVTKLPNLGVVSLAGNLPGHEVKVVDLVLRRPAVGRAVREVLASFQPQLAGLSAMTFQFDTLLEVARLVREAAPGVRLVAGGYHATLMSDAVLAKGAEVPFDFLVRGEGETTLQELVEALERGSDSTELAAIHGLSFRRDGQWVRNPDRPIADLTQIALPDRAARLATGFDFLGVPFDVVETSRGCPSACTFCSITGMYGRSFRAYPLARVVEDIRHARAAGARAIFIVDDNITHDARHFSAVCRAIVGFEAMSPARLRQMKKPTSPELNLKTAALLRRHDIAVLAGIIVGYPDDTRGSVHDELRAFRQLQPDLIYAQYLTPYPGTPLREEMLAEGLVTNVDDFRRYNGFDCNVRTRHLTRDELHRALKLEATLFALRPSHLWRNRILRWHGPQLLRSFAYTLGSDLYNIVTARGVRRRLEL